MADHYFMSARHQSYLFLILVAAIWGIAPPVIKHVLAYLPADIFLAYRFVLTILIMTPVLLISEPRTWHVLSQLSARDWLILLLAGLLGSTFQLGFLFWGLSLTSTIDGAIINAVSPVLTALGGYLILREKISRHQIIGLIVAFTGTCLIVLEPILSGFNSDSGSFIGNFLVLLGTLSWTTYVLITKRFLNHKISPLLLTTVMFYVGTFAMSTLVILTRASSATSILNQLAEIPVSAQLGIWYMALISGGLAYWLYQKAQNHIKATEANIFLYLSPIFTLPISFFWLNERLTFPAIIGSLVIAAGVTIAEIGRQRRKYVT